MTIIQYTTKNMMISHWNLCSARAIRTQEKAVRICRDDAEVSWPQRAAAVWKSARWMPKGAEAHESAIIATPLALPHSPCTSFFVSLVSIQD